MKKNFLLTLTALLLSLGAMAQGTVEFSYSDNSGIYTWGSGRAERYNVAISVDNDALRGMKVVGLEIPLRTKLKATSDYEAFIASKLEVEDGKAVTDIAVKAFDYGSGGNVVVKFDEPYIIGDSIFYAGFTFVVDELNVSNKKPLSIIYHDDPNGFHLVTSKAYRTWRNMATHFGMNVPIKILIEYDRKADSGAACNLENAFLEIGKDGTVDADIANIGTTDIKDFDYVFEVDGQKAEGHVDLRTPLKADRFAGTADITINVPAMPSTGEFKGNLTITKVNGVDNATGDLVASDTVNVLEFMPIHRAVMEEFTGTWCPQCPRGMAAIEVYKKRYPDTFIALAYHNNDPMHVVGYPVMVDAFPMACIDRGDLMDPYYGLEQSPLATEKVWKERCKVFAPASVDVDASFNSDKSEIIVYTKLRFVKDYPSHGLGLTYVVLHDGLKGDGHKWQQANALSGSKPSEEEEGLDYFANLPSPASIEFHDVVVATKGTKGIEGSVPQDIKGNQLVFHETSFRISDISAELVQDLSKMHVVALLVNNKTNRIENAMKVSITDTTTGIESVKGENGSAEAHYYNINGARVDSSHKGLTIVRMADGTVKKTIRR